MGRAVKTWRWKCPRCRAPGRTLATSSTILIACGKCSQFGTIAEFGGALVKVKRKPRPRPVKRWTTTHGRVDSHLRFDGEVVSVVEADKLLNRAGVTLPGRRGR